MASPQKISPASDARTPGTTPEAPQVAGSRQSRRRPVIAAGTRLFNPLMARFAGNRWFPLYALLRHRGRRSGRTYATPVVARRTADGFLVPLAFGQGADWFRNVRAAGGCVIRWHGVEYSLVAPEVLDWAAIRPTFPPALRLLVPVFGATQFVHLRYARAQEIDA